MENLTHRLDFEVFMALFLTIFTVVVLLATFCVSVMALYEIRERAKAIKFEPQFLEVPPTKRVPKNAILCYFIQEFSIPKGTERLAVQDLPNRLFAHPLQALPSTD